MFDQCRLLAQKLLVRDRMRITIAQHNDLFTSFNERLDSLGDGGRLLPTVVVVARIEVNHKEMHPGYFAVQRASQFGIVLRLNLLDLLNWCLGRQPLAKSTLPVKDD